MYVALFCKSNYSFLEGASHPEELIQKAAEYGMEHIAICDRDGLYGIVRAHMEAKYHALHLIIGSQISMEDGSTINLLVQNKTGYKNLCKLISKARLRSKKGESKLLWNELIAENEGLLALWGGSESLLVAKAEPLMLAIKLKKSFGDRLYAILSRHLETESLVQEKLTIERALRYEIPLVAANEVLYHEKSKRKLQDILCTIKNRTSLEKAGTLLKSNSEYDLKSPALFKKLFKDKKDLIKRSFEIASRCRFSLEELRYRYPLIKLPDTMNEDQYLKKLCFDGAKLRYGEKVPKDTLTQLEKELSLIANLKYAGYFLSMWDIVNFCRTKGIICQGRGSAANSVVCYCLFITAIDPIQMKLLFERFISMERAEPPDIDLDIEHNRREEVIHYVYNKYGRSHAAMVANFIRYRQRSAIRDVGKSLELPETLLDRVSKLLSRRRKVIEQEQMSELGLNPENPIHIQLLKYSNQILNFPRHLSIHSGGFLLGQDRIDELVPIENANMPGRTVIQWDKEDVEDLCLFKVDLLALGALSMLNIAFKLLKRHYGKELNMAMIPHNDYSTFNMLKRAESIGIFQVESRAQMAMLPRMKPEIFYDLVVQISIVRPGPITGNMVHPYLRRRQGREKITYPHPMLKDTLEKTLGVPIFQEQVMKLAMIAADYTPGEADQLRRDMAAWRMKGAMERHYERLISRMTAKGIKKEFAEQVYSQIQGFAEYGFPESHAASFALITYATAYFRCHYPEIFFCSLINAQPMGFYSISTIIGDAKRHGVKILPLCALSSNWDAKLQQLEDKSIAVRMGFRFVKNIRQNDRRQLEHFYKHYGRSFSILTFSAKSGLNIKSLEQFCEAGAFDQLINNRREALWLIRAGIHSKDSSLGYFGYQAKLNFKELRKDQKIIWDFSASSHSTRGHPIKLLRNWLSKIKIPSAKEIKNKRNGELIRYVGLVICKQMPGTAKGIVFLTMEDETEILNIILKPGIYETYRILVNTRQILGITGRLQISPENVIHLMAENVWDPDMKEKIPKQKTRDFQ